MDIKDILGAAGGPSAVARKIGRHHSTVLRWTRVPPRHARAVAALTGIALHVIRPDIYPAPSPVPSQSPGEHP